ncbi:MAG: signal peptidase II [Clostridia bacterium]|nr:signal peptidase II [Clostridia bacterium]MBP5593388.1 signal peptidase II [Clostridia bacterium]MBP5648446.1 signal peptidase II [Clostridia bacterium]
MKFDFKSVKLKAYLRQILLASAIIAASLTLDLISKELVVKASADWPMRELEVIEGFFSIHYVTNTGAAFSIGAGWEGFYAFIIPITFVFLAFVLFLLYFYTDKRHPLFIIGISLIFSGALGNLIDRIALGYVRDFLDFVFFGWDFAVFNIADACLVAGVIITIIWAFVIYFPSASKEKAAKEEAEAE